MELGPFSREPFPWSHETNCFASVFFQEGFILDVTMVAPSHSHEASSRRLFRTNLVKQCVKRLWDSQRLWTLPKQNAHAQAPAHTSCDLEDALLLTFWRSGQECAFEDLNL